MICSLTRSAAAEVAGRDTPILDSNIGTLHSFAFRALGIEKDQIADSPKRLKDWNEWVRAEKEPQLERTTGAPDVDDAATENVFRGETQGDQFAQDYQIARSRLMPLEALSPHRRHYIKLWEQFKQDMGFVDFTDLLEYALRDTEAAPGNPAVIMGDETQDISQLGMRLLRHWGQRAEWLVTVGDPLQCLFHWAGTDPTAFIEPDIDAKDKRILAQSYRVPAEVHGVALQWIAPLKRLVEERFGKPIQYHPRAHAGGVSSLHSAHFKYPEPAIRDAERHLAEGKSVMFVAACSYMLEPTLHVLRSEGIPFHNPWRVKRGDWNPLARRKGSNSAADRILSFLRLSPDVWGEHSSLWTWRDLWRWVEILEADGLLQRGAKKKIEEAAKAPVGADDPITSSVFDEWFATEAILTAIEASAGGDLAWLEKRILATKRKALEYPIRVAQKRGAAVLREKPRVIVGTIHSLKGSEADVVYLFPDLSLAGMDEWQRIGSEGHHGIRRAFYVGITRARETLVLCGQASPLAVQWSLN